MLADLSGRIALVTGSGAGMGRGIAEVLAAQGATVWLSDLQLDAVQSAATEIGSSARAVQLDVTDDGSVAAAFGEIEKQDERIDILVNNAGIVTATPGREGAPDEDIDWTMILDVNLRGTVRCASRAAATMRDRRSGKIINIASMAGHAARRVGGAYGVSKAAVLRYTKGLAVELAPFNINVNAVCPGAVWTPLQERGTARRQRENAALATQDPYDLFVAAYSPMTPLARPQSVADVGKAVAFLASEDACNITGQCLHVDGGAILRD